MLKKMGLTSEQVCAIGKWKNTTAFTQHYLRLDAVSTAQSLFNRVHSVSPWGSAESDWSHTPGTRGEPGGSDQEGEAQTHGETRFLFAGVVPIFFGAPRGVSYCLREAAVGDGTFTLELAN